MQTTSQEFGTLICMFTLNLNIKKCQVVSFGRHVDKGHTYKLCDINNHIIPLERGNKVLDLGVWFDEKLSFSEHIQTKINKAYMMLGIIKRNFKRLTVPTFVMLYTSMVYNLEVARL